MESDFVQEKIKFSRRDFLKNIAIAGLSLSSMITNAYYLLDANLNLPPENKERFLIKTVEGYKVGLLLGNHGNFNHKTGRMEMAETATHIGSEDLYTPVGAFFIDSSADYLNPKVNDQIVENALRIASQEVPNFYRTPFEHGIKNNIPFIFGDITLRGITTDDFVQYVNLHIKGSLAALATMLAEGGKLIAENYIDFFKKSMTRRDFLKLLVRGGILSTIYFSSPAYTHLARSLGINLDSPIARDFQAIFTDLIHPDNYPIVMRNIVWALKCRDFYDQGIIPKEKIINIVGGFAHQFFDFFMRYPEVAKRYWSIFNYKEVAGKFSQGDPGWVYKSLIFYPSSKNIEIIEHERLKSLVT